MRIRAIQFDQDVAVFKSGWGGTHNFKFGYQPTGCSNDISQHWKRTGNSYSIGDGNHERGLQSRRHYSPTIPTVCCVPSPRSNVRRLHAVQWLMSPFRTSVLSKGDRFTTVFSRRRLDDRPWHYSQFRHSVRQRYLPARAEPLACRPAHPTWLGDRLPPHRSA